MSFPIGNCWTEISTIDKEGKIISVVQGVIVHGTCLN